MHIRTQSGALNTSKASIQPIIGRRALPASRTGSRVRWIAFKLRFRTTPCSEDATQRSLLSSFLTCQPISDFRKHEAVLPNDLYDISPTTTLGTTIILHTSVQH